METLRKQRDTDEERPRTRAGRPRLRTLSELDSRTAAARRARDLVTGIERDLGGDLSAAQRELVQRAALLGAMTEDAEVRWLEQERVDLTEYGTLVDRQRRILETLGLDRKPRLANRGSSLDAATRRIVATIEARAHG